uniref:Putative reverse transcriptase domain, ribonuclease H-like domain, aspartic peptidase domain protein n=1 Tax=Tanacetum cinerariifolium TaxID=118510 RepID=A0A6L2MB00_TANCI|nr:putative reverse transcriptase domain, ribonuclease H-like domain, aspartic peptidase domain protein [Tanacetum cinerariifolium]
MMRYGHFKFTVMPFGLTNAPAVFIDLMNRVCKLYLGKFFIVFIDDILIYSKSKEDHEVLLKLVLELLKNEKLFSNLSKYEFWLQEVRFIRHVVNNNDIRVESSKIEAMDAIRDMTVLRIGREQKEAFQTLKDNFCNAPILSLPDGLEDFVVYCDASNQGLGCVVMQRGKKELNMRQRRWIELFSNFDSEIRYHPRKANVVAEALSRERDNRNTTGPRPTMERKEDGGMYFIWVPLIGDVRTLIMDETHASRYLVHSGVDKTYYDLRDMWKDIATYVSICLTCLKKLVRLYIDGIVAGHEVPVSIISDRDGRFTSRVLANITKSLRDVIGYEYGLSSSDGWTKKCMSLVLWAEIKESRLIGPELVQEMIDKVVLIKEKLKAARDRQKNYADNRRKLLEFDVKDQVLLKVSP